MRLRVTALLACLGVVAVLLSLAGPAQATVSQRHNVASVVCVEPGYHGRTGWSGGPYHVWDNSWLGRTCIRRLAPNSFKVLTSLPPTPALKAFPAILYGCRWKICTPGSYLPMNVSDAIQFPLWVTVNASPPWHAVHSRYQGDFDGYFYPTSDTTIHGTAEIVIVTQFGAGAIPRYRVHARAPPAFAPAMSRKHKTYLFAGGLRFRFTWWMTDGGDPSVKAWPLFYFSLLAPRVHVRIPLSKFLRFLRPYLTSNMKVFGGFGYGFENWWGGKGEYAKMVVDQIPVITKLGG